MKSNPSRVSRTTTPFFYFFSLCSLCLCGESPAHAQSELNKPYELHIVVHVAQNRLLTNLADRFKNGFRLGRHSYLHAKFWKSTSLSAPLFHTPTKRRWFKTIRILFFSRLVS